MAGSWENDNLTNIRVSTKLGEVRNSILERGIELQRNIPVPMGAFVNDLLKQLEGHVCRIAFIGQVKAGKSSIINALIQRPHFLPTNVNPSTAVVTRLFLGSKSADSDTALFHFFSDEEWNRIIANEHSLQGHPWRDSPPSKREILDTFKARTKKQFGDNLDNLIGKHHLFAEVTPELLKQYIGASESFDSSGASEIYSDVTRIAEVFLKSHAYLYPSTLIDTPGVNDLFFIRDDITYANLAEADVYVLILTARHPFSASDLSLLRLLKGLHKDRILVVINRIDSVANLSAEIGHIEAFARQILNKEFPQAGVPIVSASALWANMALSLDEGHGEVPITPDLMQYAEKLGLEQGVRAAGRRQSGYFSPKDKELLITCSGIPHITTLIGKAIAQAVSEEHLLPAVSTLAAIAHNGEISCRFAHKTLTSTHSSAGAADMKHKAVSSFNQLKSLSESVQKFVDESAVRIDETIISETKAIENYIFRMVSAFADAQSERYFREGPNNFAYSFARETLDFRAGLAEDLTRYVNNITEIIADKHRLAESGLRNMVKSYLPAVESAVQFGLESRRKRSSLIVSLGKATALEGEEFWDWFASLGARKERDYLRQIIISEFLIILDEVIGRSRSHLRSSASEGIHRLKLLVLSAILPIVEQIELAVQINRGSIGPNEADAQIRGKMVRYEALSTQLGSLKKLCILLPDDY
jgi:GTP-binding protein EngB required for normal cell division